MKKLLVAFFLIASVVSAEPVTITNVKVIIGPYELQPEWQFPVVLNGGQSLVLTQNHQGLPNTTSSYNADASEYAYLHEYPIVQYTTNGIDYTFTDWNGAIISHWDDNNNEAKEFELVFKTANLEWWIGYADNVHPNCAIPHCFPTNFFSPTYFQGTFAYRQPGTAIVGPDECLYGAPTCMDAFGIWVQNTDAIEIDQHDHNPVPEPASLILFGSGLIFVARKYAKSTGR